MVSPWPRCLAENKDKRGRASFDSNEYNAWATIINLICILIGYTINMFKLRLVVY